MPAARKRKKGFSTRYLWAKRSHLNFWSLLASCSTHIFPAWNIVFRPRNGPQLSDGFILLHRDRDTHTVQQGFKSHNNASNIFRKQHSASSHYFDRKQNYLWQKCDWNTDKTSRQERIEGMFYWILAKLIINDSNISKSNPCRKILWEKGFVKWWHGVICMHIVSTSFCSCNFS